jgi:hypothetical protein
LRKFHIKAAERHIDICAEIKHKAKPPPTKEEVEEKKLNRQLQRSPLKGGARRSPVSNKSFSGGFKGMNTSGFDHHNKTF